MEAVVYAKDLDSMVAFYRDALDLRVDDSGDGFACLVRDDVVVNLVRIPEEIAREIEIASPPQRREDTPIKLVVAIASLTGLRERFAGSGGVLDPDDRVWTWRSRRRLDGIDPEGNVVQVSAPLE